MVQLIQTDEAFTVDGRTHTHTHTHTYCSSKREITLTKNVILMYTQTALNMLICEMLTEHLKCQFTKINKFPKYVFEELFYIVGSAESNGFYDNGEH